MPHKMLDPEKKSIISEILVFLLTIIGTVVLFCALLIPGCFELTESLAYAAETPGIQISTGLAGNPDEINVDRLANAIYLAEGGEKAKKPFGILSVPCSGYEDCRRVCKNTIRNNFSRWLDWGHKQHPTYIAFLASRYAPVGVKNDPTGLNKNWINNVTKIYADGGA